MSYYVTVVVGTDTLLHKKIKKSSYQKIKEKNIYYYDKKIKKK